MAPPELGDRFFSIVLIGVTIPPGSEHEVSRFIVMMADYLVDDRAFAFYGFCPSSTFLYKMGIALDRAFSSVVSATPAR